LARSSPCGVVPEAQETGGDGFFVFDAIPVRLDDDGYLVAA
jgi:hypothetical protein